MLELFVALLHLPMYVLKIKLLVYFLQFQVDLNILLRKSRLVGCYYQNFCGVVSVLCRCSYDLI